jgi:signal peptidase II
LLARPYVADRAWWVTVVFGMLLGGTLGNLLDRLRMGHVVDFVDVGIGSLRWPSFNVADSSFVVGIIILAVYLSFAGDKTEKLHDDQHPDQPYAV